MRTVSMVFAALALSVSASTATAKAPATWDGLVQVKAKKVALAYLLPDADFRAYSKVMFDPPQVAFAKNWQRDFNRSSMTLGACRLRTSWTNAASRASQDRSGSSAVCLEWQRSWGIRIQAKMSG